MKTRIFLFIIPVLLLSCKGETHKSKTTQSLGAVVNKNEITVETSAATVNIKDIFLLLPDDVLPMQGINIANRKLLLNHIGDEKAYEISQTPIDVCDVKNGYLSLTGMQYGWEIYYWNLKDKRKLVAVNTGKESGSEIRIFYYQNGNLTEDHNYQLGGNQKYKLTDFVDVLKISDDSRKFAENQFNQGDYYLYYQLPQNGTSIKVNLDTDQLMDYNETYEIPYEATKEVILKWKNEKWEKF